MDISSLEWSKRILIVSVTDEDDNIFIKTKKFFKENECQKNNRNIELIIFKKFKNKDFKTPKFVKNNYGIWLLGYDGMIKDFSPDDSILRRVFKLIDLMTMRKNEKINTC